MPHVLLLHLVAATSFLPLGCLTNLLSCNADERQPWLEVPVAPFWGSSNLLLSMIKAGQLNRLEQKSLASVAERIPSRPRRPSYCQQIADSRAVRKGEMCLELQSDTIARDQSETKSFRLEPVFLLVLKRTRPLTMASEAVTNCFHQSISRIGHPLRIPCIGISLIIIANLGPCSSEFRAPGPIIGSCFMDG